LSRTTSTRGRPRRCKASKEMLGSISSDIFSRLPLRQGQ
jgi:hypothetical protein